LSTINRDTELVKRNSDDSYRGPPQPLPDPAMVGGRGTVAAASDAARDPLSGGPVALCYDQGWRGRRGER